MIKATIQRSPYCTEMTFPCTEKQLSNAVLTDYDDESEEYDSPDDDEDLYEVEDQEETEGMGM